MDGEFSAVDNVEQPILTVNAPIGLGFRDNPGDIVNRSFAQNEAEEFVGLEVLSGQTLALVGGNLNFEGGNVTASGGLIELGGIIEAGTVTLNNNGNLNFPNNVARANITLSNASDVYVRGAGGGNININTNNIILETGELGRSSLRGGIAVNSTSSNAQGGNVTINATGVIKLSDDSFIDVSTFGQGNAGNVFIQANDSIILDNSVIFSLVRDGAIGDGGDIDIEAKSLSLINGSQIASAVLRQEDNSPISGGQGNGGNIKVTTTDFINISGVDAGSFSSGLLTITEQGANGQAGDITVNTNIFRLSNSGNINSATRNLSNGGNITINANTFEATSGGQVRATTRSNGNPGNITLNINDKVIISGSDLTFEQRLAEFGENFVSDAGANSGLFVNSTPESTGQAGLTA